MAEVQPSRVGRRLSAIAVADVAGYSRLMSLDEVGTASILREHRAVSDALDAKHGGRIVKTTGDGLLIEFTSVVDAVECAVALQAVMAERNAGFPQDRRMLFRIGINLGDILVEGDDILGDGVNIAARLEGIAEPGGICISASAYDQVRGKVAVEFADLGEQSLKNIARPVRAYAVVRDGLGGMTQNGVKMPILQSAPRLSIVFLPFANMGGDPEQDYFVDGVTESLTTDLSRISGSFVIGRHTAFTYKGKAVDLKKVGRELKVRFTLATIMRRGRTWPWIRMRPFLARFSEPLWSGHLASWADFITTTPELEFSVHTAGAGEFFSTTPIFERILAISRPATWDRMSSVNCLVCSSRTLAGLACCCAACTKDVAIVSPSLAKSDRWGPA